MDLVMLALFACCLVLVPHLLLAARVWSLQEQLRELRRQVAMFGGQTERIGRLQSSIDQTNGVLINLARRVFVLQEKIEEGCFGQESGSAEGHKQAYQGDGSIRSEEGLPSSHRQRGGGATP